MAASSAACAMPTANAPTLGRKRSSVAMATLKPAPADPDDDADSKLEEISWDEWFEKFDDNDLAFPYQQEKASGEDSTFFKLVSR